jgi:rhamnopyranosyl-N-acetylglucosaminyl-diphospho-decaprenol beta-1,3/1,4-galactofuranosyltransferase
LHAIFGGYFIAFSVLLPLRPPLNNNLTILCKWPLGLFFLKNKMERENVAAVVLTYNRLHLLKECITAIKSQTLQPDEIIVIDNGSKEDTSEWLKSQQGINTIFLPQNIGPAAGMKRGLQAAFEKGYLWIWIMDDDGLPHAEALEKLLNAKPGSKGARNSIVLDKEDKKTLVFKLLQFKTLDDIKEEFVEGEIMPWNGTLFHRTIIERLGYPISELFLWGEENEYYYRIKKSGLFDIFSVRSSWHYHPRTSGFFYKSKWDVKTDWRAYYFIRNKYTVYLSKYRQKKTLAAFQYLVFNAGMLYYILFQQQDQKRKKAKLLFYATKDGLKLDYTKSTPDVVALLKKL